MEVRIRTANGRDTILASDVIAELRGALDGGVLTPESEGYAEARSIWNAMIERRPAIIALCSTPLDVMRTVRFARAHDLLVSVRGGGHNIAGNALCDGGLTIDLSRMRAIQVDPDRRVARVEPGVTLGELDAATQRYGLATPVGINSTTGVAGLTLGGGFGWTSRRFGLTIDNLASAEVITAAGDLVRANPVENPDLFWAIRGGGGNFGIVTSFEFRLHPVGPEILAGLVIHPLDDARSVLRFYREFVKRTPEDFVCWFVMRQAPPLPFLAEEWHGREILVLAMAYFGNVKDGELVAEPLRKFGKPLADVVAPQQYTDWQKALDPLLTPGARNYWKSHDFRELGDGLIDTFVEYARKIPDPQTEIAFAQLGGAVSRVPPEATAYTHRDAEYVVNIHGRWSDPSRDDAVIAWARGLWQACTPYATGGVYVNFLTQEESDRIPAAYGTNYDRLVEVKNRWDPGNLFRVNQNVRPAVLA